MYIHLKNEKKTMCTVNYMYFGLCPGSFWIELFHPLITCSGSFHRKTPTGSSRRWCASLEKNSTLASFPLSRNPPTSSIFSGFRRLTPGGARLVCVMCFYLIIFLSDISRGFSAHLFALFVCLSFLFCMIFLWTERGKQENEYFVVVFFTHSLLQFAFLL